MDFIDLITLQTFIEDLAVFENLVELIEILLSHYLVQDMYWRKIYDLSILYSVKREPLGM